MAGSRGKSSFAKKLGLSPSTYDYYEASRVPPADTLVRIAEVTGVDLVWLLTGRHGSGQIIAADNPILNRAAQLLADHPQSASALEAFIDLLSAAAKFPAKGGANGQAEADVRGGVSADRPKLSDTAGTTRTGTASGSAPIQTPPKLAGIDPSCCVPILGRSAAGVAKFWSSPQEAQGITRLDDLIRRSGALGGGMEVQPAKVGATDAQAPNQAVQLVTLRKAPPGLPDQFVIAPFLKRTHRDTFALRIDGESMSPEIRHGDIVVASPTCPAEEGKAAIVQLANQIGVTCKLYRRMGTSVCLIPINEQFPSARYDAKAVEWALRVLARVRP
ncbi:MAG: S24 family peptidase [Phycisphaerae bacterium]